MVVYRSRNVLCWFLLGRTASYSQGIGKAVMPKRQPPKPDLRLNWRDPNMPVLRDYRMGNGERKIVVDADYEHRYREMLINTASESTFPHYRNDPTYNLRKERK
jgi:hypothetical protein